MLRRLVGRRWWWFVGVGWLVGWTVLIAPRSGLPAFRRLMWTDRRALLLVMLPLLLGVAWLVVIAPILESGVRGFTERRPAARRARICRMFAWVPTVIFSLLLVQVGLVKTLGVQDFGWFGPRYVVTLAGAVALSLFYGRMMSRHLLHRVRTAAARAGVCFSCNYDVSYLAGDRCPECGAPLRLVAATPTE